MDPNAALACILDPYADDEDKIDCGEALIAWMDRGGFEPSDPRITDADGDRWSRDDVWTLLTDHGLHRCDVDDELVDEDAGGHRDRDYWVA